MIAASLFSGIGAPEVAAPGWDWRWCAEIDPFACHVLAARHGAGRPQRMPAPDAPGLSADQRRERRNAIEAVAGLPETMLPNLGDVSAEDFAERAVAAGRPDAIVFGSPCQDFSLAGKRLGLDAPRGNLTLVALSVLARIKPRWFVFENVPGLFSNWSGGPAGPDRIGQQVEGSENSDFAAFLGAVDDLGYSLAWTVLDAQYAGLAQRRERIVAVGYFGDWRGPAAVLFEPESLLGHHPPSREAWERTAGGLAARAGGGGRPDGGDGRHDQLVPDVAWALQERDSKGADSSTKEGHLIPVAFSSKDHGQDAGPISPALRAMGHDKSWMNGGGQVAVAFQTRVARNGRGNASEIVPALNGADAGATSDMRPCVAAAGMGVRRLTPRECERLQGFPDDYTLVPFRGRLAADTSRYKALGNSQAVPKMRWVLERVEFVDGIVRP